MILHQRKISQGQDYDVVVFQPCSCDVHSCAVADFKRFGEITRALFLATVTIIKYRIWVFPVVFLFSSNSVKCLPSSKS